MFLFLFKASKIRLLDNFLIRFIFKTKKKLILHGMEPKHNGPNIKKLNPDYDIYATFTEGSPYFRASYFPESNGDGLKTIRPFKDANAKHLCIWIFSNRKSDRLKLLKNLNDAKISIQTNAKEIRKLFPDCKDKDNICYFSHYLFTFTIESFPEYNDYSTEKLWNPFFAGSVPIVNGPNNIRNYLPKHSVIFLEDYKSMNDLRNYLEYLSKNETAYMEYHAWRKEPFPAGLEMKIRTAWTSHLSCNLCVEVARLRYLDG